MPVLGSRQLLDLALPTGIDGAEILRFSMRDGVTAATAVARGAQVIGAVNSALMSRYGNLLSLTAAMAAIHRQGDAASGRTPRKTAGAQPDGIRSEELGHQWRIWDYEDALSWDKLYLRDAYMRQIENDLLLIADRWMNAVRYDIFSRMLLNTEYLIGSTGYDVPWAIGTGTNVNYIPPQYGATPFTSAHSHFNVVDSSGSDDYGTLLNANVVDLRHHGYFGRLACLVSGSDVDTVAALTSFVELKPADVQVVAGNTSAPIRVTAGEFEGVPGELFGYYKTTRGYVELFYDDYMPSGYNFMTKPMGVGNPMNGLVIREHPAQGFGLTVDPQVNKSMNPELDKVLFPATHGVGVANRLNGVAGYIADGATVWVNPTLS